MPPIQPPEQRKPRTDLITGGCDWIDLQAGFVRVNRLKASEILGGWDRHGELTLEERTLILNRFDNP